MNIISQSHCHLLAVKSLPMTQQGLPRPIYSVSLVVACLGYSGAEGLHRGQPHPVFTHWPISPASGLGYLSWNWRVTGKQPPSCKG